MKRKTNKNIFVLPTDTVYGIFTKFEKMKQKKKIFELKNRKKDKPLSIYVNNIQNIEKFCKEEYWNSVKLLIKKLLPGPYTFILLTNYKIPFITKNRKIAIRYTRSKILNDFISRFGILCGTSFNISEESEISIIENEDEVPIKDEDIFIVKGECEYKQSSFIIEQISEKEFIFKRKNEIFMNLLKKKLNDKNIILYEEKIIIK